MNIPRTEHSHCGYAMCLLLELSMSTRVKSPSLAVVPFLLLRGKQCVGTKLHSIRHFEKDKGHHSIKRWLMELWI